MNGCMKCFNKAPCHAIGAPIQVWSQSGADCELIPSTVEDVRLYNVNELQYWCYLVRDSDIEFWVACHDLPLMDIKVDLLCSM